MSAFTGNGSDRTNSARLHSMFSLNKMAAFCAESKDCKETFILRFKELQDECTALLSSKPDVEELQLLQKSLVKCQSSIATLASQEKLNQNTLANLLKDYSKCVMDKTYVEECRLVNNDFKDNDSKQKLLNIIEQLSIPEDIAKQFLPSLENDIKIEELLGKDVVECLYWRRGALLYMYCHTIYSDNERWTGMIADFIKDCEVGVEFLQKMLSVRTSLEDDKEYMGSRHDGTMELLMQGIFSDTHLLGLMYAGELCYWHWKTLNLDKNSESTRPEMATSGDTTSPLNSLAEGKRVLGRYIRTVRGPLKGMGWDTIKAEQYLNELNNVQDVGT